MRMSCPYGSSVVLREARSTSLTAAADILDLEIRWKCHLDIGWLTRSRRTLTRAALCPGPHGEASDTSAVFLHNLGGAAAERARAGQRRCSQFSGLTGSRPRRTSKYSAGWSCPPESPTEAITSPAATGSPTLRKSSSLWPYRLM